MILPKKSCFIFALFIRYAFLISPSLEDALWFVRAASQDLIPYELLHSKSSQSVSFPFNSTSLYMVHAGNWRQLYAEGAFARLLREELLPLLSIDSSYEKDDVERYM